MMSPERSPRPSLGERDDHHLIITQDEEDERSGTSSSLQGPGRRGPGRGGAPEPYYYLEPQTTQSGQDTTTTTRQPVSISQPVVVSPNGGTSSWDMMGSQTGLGGAPAGAPGPRAHGGAPAPELLAPPPRAPPADLFFSKE